MKEINELNERLDGAMTGRLPAERIDECKRAALKELEDMPISHAKASGKFEYIMAELESMKEEADEEG